MSIKSKQIREEISTTDLMTKKTVNDIKQVTKLLNKQEEDDSHVYFCKGLIGRSKSLPAK